MNYRVVSLHGSSFPFHNYSEALLFREANGGVIYQKVYSEKNGKR